MLPILRGKKKLPFRCHVADFEKKSNVQIKCHVEDLLKKK